MVRKEYIILLLLFLLLGCAEDGLLNLATNHPKIDQISPEEGLPGDNILIEGSNLGDVDSAWVNGTLTSINNQTAASFTIQILPEMTSGPVIVRNPFGKTLGPDLQIIKLPIVIDSISPLSGIVTTPVQVYGKEFDQLITDFELQFNGVVATVSSKSDTLISTTVPAGATSGIVFIKNGLDTIQGSEFIIEELPDLVIGSIDPEVVEAFAEVTISGTNFGTDISDIRVLINEVQTVIDSISDTKIIFVVPSQATSGAIVIQKISTDQEVTGPDITILDAMTIQSINPTSGEAGTQVTITGTNFGTDVNDILVTVAGDQGQVSSVMDTQIVFEVLQGSNSGPVAIEKVSTGQQVTGPDFTILGTMTIQSINPTSGEAGTQVTITGTNFGTDINDILVTVGGDQGQVSSVMDTQIVFEVVQGSNSGPVAVDKVSTGQQATGPDFTILDPITIQSINPTSGEAGTQVTITGTNFGTDVNDILVTVGGDQGQVSSVMDTQIVFEVLQGSNSGPVAVDKVSTGQQATGSDFTILDPVTIQSINPTSGEAGTQVTITGTNFGTDVNDILVTVGGDQGQVSSVMDTQIVFEVLQGSNSGPVAVEKVSTGQQVTGPDFTILDPITIQSINPTSGLVLTQVTITGLNFGNNVNDIAVTVNGAPSTTLSVYSTEIVFEVGQLATTGPVLVEKISTSQQATGPDFTVVTGPSITVSTVVSSGVGNPLDILQLGNVTVNSSDQDHQIFLYNLTNNSVNTIGTGTPGLVNGTSPQFNSPTGIALDASNILYVADRQNHVIRVVSGGNTQTLAGVGPAGFADGGLQQQAQFNEPVALVVIGTFIYVADFQNHAIRRIDVQNDQVVTIAGNGQAGFADGTGQITQLDNPIGLAEDLDGNLLIADFGNHSIRKLNLTTFELTTVAGNGSSGFVNGDLNAARFNGPVDLSVDSQGVIYVAEQTNHVIRKIEAGNVTTMAGTGVAGNADGAADQAQFNAPTGIFLVSDTEILVADYLNGAIRRITIQ